MGINVMQRGRAEYHATATCRNSKPACPLLSAYPESFLLSSCCKRSPKARNLLCTLLKRCACVYAHASNLSCGLPWLDGDALPHKTAMPLAVIHIHLCVLTMCLYGSRGEIFGLSAVHSGSSVHPGSHAHVLH